MPILFQTLIILFLLTLGFLVGGWRERSHFKSLTRREAEYQDIGIANLKGVTDPQSVEFAGLVVADCVIATDYFKGFLSAIRNILGGELRSYESLMERARREAILRLLERAREMGATELWNLRLETSNIMSGGNAKRSPAVAVEVTASATAIKAAGLRSLEMGREDEHSIFNEPHLRGEGEVDPSEAHVDAQEAKRRRDEEPAESVYDEPDILPGRGAARIEADWTCSACGYNLRGLMTGQPCPECGRIELYRPAPPDAPGYARWLREHIAATSTAKTWRVTIYLLILGGPWAILSALMGAEPAGLTGVPLSLMVLFGPATEEVMKLGATLVVAETRPFLFKRREQLQIAVLGSALAFAVIENLIYLNVYIPNPSMLVVVWRWTVCVALHVGCTLIASRGLIATWDMTMTEGRPPQLARAFPMLITAIIVHGSYNFSMVILQMAGYLR